MKTQPQRPLVAVVSHSHWDREWYLPFEVFRHRLVCVLEDLLALLETDPDYQHFMLDGQAVLLEDIAEVRPDLLERVSAQARQGRLSVGPWYVLQDEFLVSGESIARNLLMGREVSKRAGQPMNVGYIPDAFGHVSQIPRILRGFQLDSAVLWRGVGDQIERNEWQWNAPAGASVLCLWLRWNYSTAERLPNDVAAVGDKLRADVERAHRESRVDLLLWMNGTDHQQPQPYLSTLLSDLRREHPGVEIAHTGLEDVVQRAKERLGEQPLEQLSGELRRTGPGVGFLLPGVLSARSWQQRDHDRAEWALVRQAEPFATLLGAKRTGSLRYAWKTLLKCQPHDSICGCSVDEVHQEIDVRQLKVQQLADILLETCVRERAERRAAHPGGISKDPSCGALIIANPHPFVTDALVETELIVARSATAFHLQSAAGEIPFELLADVPFDPTLPTSHPDAERLRRLSLRIGTRALASGGLEPIQVVDGPPSALSSDCEASQDAISNPFLRVAAIPGGLRVEDKGSGDHIDWLFEDCTDRGDEYNFSALADEEPALSTAASSQVQAQRTPTGARLRLDLDWTRQERLEESRTERTGQGRIGITLWVHLTGDSRTLAVDMLVNNHAQDHRLRARFVLPNSPGSFVTDAPFDWIERPAGDPAPAPASQELPMPQHPVSSMLGVDLPASRLALGAVGLKEVELNPHGELSLTVLRAVGWLSRADLAPEREREAGPALASPAAQGLGEHRFRLALGFAEPTGPVSLIHRQLEPILFPPVAIAVENSAIESLPLISVEPPSVRLAAVKRSETGEGIIVRLAGPSGEQTVTASVTLHQPLTQAYLSDLDERAGTALSADSSQQVLRVSVPIAARDIATLLLT